MKYVVLDLEMCKVPKGCRCKEYKWSQETIEIGAVLLDDDFRVLDQFDTFVKPKYGRVDYFIEHLTGISEYQLKNAPSFEEAIDLFTKWIPDDEVKCVSWSTSDSAQIEHEMVSKGHNNSRMVELFEGWIDCQKLFDDRVGMVRPSKLEEALIIADIYPEGNMHNGLSDAQNTAILFGKLENGEEFVLNEIYQSAAIEESVPMVVCIGDLFRNIAIM